MANYSFDLDNTVTSHPELAPIASALQALGHNIFIVTGRKSAEGVEDLLFTSGFPPVDAIITKAGHSGSTRLFKEAVLKEHNIDVHWDDDENLNFPQSHPTKVLSFQGSKLRFGRTN